eukprot:5045876-Lingulodinium_polyedra.AAC.1
MNTSFALSALGELYDLLLPDSEAAWKCALLAVMGNACRRLYKAFDACPWKHCAMYNPEIPMQDREEAAREFL